MRTSKKIPQNGRNLTESQYTIHLEVGFILALLIMISLFKMEIRPTRNEVSLTIVEHEIVKMEDVEVTKQISRPPPPPRPLVPVSVSNDAIIFEEEINIDAEFDIDNLTVFELPAPPSFADEAEDELDEEQIFVAVEKMPDLVGGIASVMKHIEYPEIARKAGIEGKVFVQFVIDEKGNVLNPVVIRGIGGGCDEAAIEAIKKAKFVPGLQRGKPVKVKYSMPIVFKLSAGKAQSNS